MTKKTITYIALGVGGAVALYLVIRAMGASTSSAAPLVNQQLNSAAAQSAAAAAAAAQAANPTVTAQGPLYAAYTPIGLAPIASASPSTVTVGAPVASTGMLAGSNFVDAGTMFDIVK
jgi:hypothetical protein